MHQAEICEERIHDRQFERTYSVVISMLFFLYHIFDILWL